MIENNQPSPLTDDCISQAMLVTYEKLINDSKHENSFLIKVEKGLQRKGAVDIRFLTMFENVKEFAESGLAMVVFAQVAFFIGVLVLALIYEWRKGGMTWDR